MLEAALNYSWLILALPVLSFVLIGIAIIASRKAQRFAQVAAPAIIVICLAAALAVAVGSLSGVLEIQKRQQMLRNQLTYASSIAHDMESGPDRYETLPPAPTHATTEGRATSEHGVPSAEHGTAPAHETAPAGEHAAASVPSFERTIAWMTPQARETAPANRTLTVGILLDPLSASMLVVVLVVSLLVQIYSFKYMEKHEHPRFYLYMSLFTASMLGLVIASTLLQLFIFWELVGVCSYLLIGFWYRKPEAARAAIKAFVVTRFGDLGLLIAVMVLWYSYGDLSFANLQQAINTPAVALPIPLAAVALLIFFGAAGKSAQFPLHIWLPDAMEGPTSVSALIHAATMVAAGVFLVARMHFLFMAAPLALLVVACIGVLTALIAASIGLAQTDMKKVMAYSTISQLGYMMMGLGLAAPAAAFFHLTTHAFFKALLFLTAGSVIHAVHSQDMWQMGGLWRKMKVTAITCAIGGLALAGIPPLAGFFSKDALLESALAAAVGISPANIGISQPVAWIVLAAAIATVLMTAFYTARMWSLVFLGKPRSHGAEHAHESHPAMLFSLLVLAGLTLVAGLPFVKHLTGMQWGEHALPGWFQPWVWGLTAVATLTGIAGLAWGYKAYHPAPAAEPLKRLGPAYTGMVNLWYIDAFFRWLAGRVVLVLGRTVAWFDKSVIDGILVDGSCWVTGRVGHLFRVSGAGPAPGQLQYYALIIVLVLAVFIVGLTFGDFRAAAQEVLGR